MKDLYIILIINRTRMRFSLIRNGEVGIEMMIFLWRGKRGHGWGEIALVPFPIPLGD